MRDDLLIQHMREALQSLEGEEAFDRLYAILQRDGIIDEHGNVLKRVPAPPYVREVNGEPKKSARPRKRKPRRSSAS